MVLELDALVAGASGAPPLPVISLDPHAPALLAFTSGTAGVANAADINFASSVAEQYGRHGVRCNTVNPGPVLTDCWETLERAFAGDKGIMDT